MRAYLVDDEPLALQRLRRLLEATGRVEIAGSTTDPEAALRFLAAGRVDVLFLDIQMPGMSGFELLAKLPSQPWVIFTTAYDQYALQAFAVNSIDYLLKPIEAQQLDRALHKLERLLRAGQPPDLHGQIQKLLDHWSARPQFPDRIASRVGDRVQFLSLDRITHFFAKDKLTYAATPAKNYPVDHSIAELEQKLDPQKFVRIHRATLLNIAYVHELDAWFAGRLLVRLKDEKRTELPVARDRVPALKQRLGL
ncbi:MAG TPA: LytTR family DNA-binding domain-containing protein [Bryobacterales bacterium]|nr:LytTR family DNA-binding domain-containing protein [Bryobacterales bacterium]